MDRRRFLTRVGLTVLGFGLGAGAVVAGEAVAGGFRASAPTPTTPRPGPSVASGSPRAHPDPIPSATPLPPHFGAPQLTRVKLPGATLYGLPGSGSLLALTVDDGASSEVVAAYTELCRRTGMRLTFFVTKKYSSWTDNAAAMRPLVENGQIQLGNHTMSHPDLTKLSAGAIQNELTGCGTFIKDTFGVDAAPYYRPPFGYLDARVRAAAHAVGYTQPVLWFGTLSDSGRITEAQVVQFAQKWFLPQHIVIGHANFDPVTHVFDQLLQLIRDRALQPVTLDDVFAR
ncbi:polysaccharide deacetylase family protein [Lysinimonas soli]|uniref:Polysaccharide deacetylase family protein n=1 Tax=Lysinimonas soli TaxID=1074233 RepID=A0ABW0NQ12_9MICO